MQKESSQDTHPHYPFEHVDLPARSLPSHHHHVRRENDTDTRDFERPHIVNGLTNILSRWGWLTPECEGRSHSRTTLSGQGSLEFPTPSHQQEKDLHSFESDETRRTTATNDKAKGASQTSFAEDYGKFNKFLHYDDSDNVQLYEKKVPAFDQTTSPEKPSQSPMLARLRRASTSNTIRELYAVKVFRHTQNTLLPLASLFQNGSQTVPLCHPNIVPIIDILYNKQKDLCLVMPYYAGGNLHSFLSHRENPRENLSTEEVNCLAIQILRAVAFLHENNIAHGDMRPEHVLLTAQGAVKVGGFGEDEDAIRELAQLSHRSPNTAPASNYKPKLCIRRRVSDLSVPYLPPERFPSRRGSRRQSYTHQDDFDIRAGDIWACGIIYMLLRSGQLLWHSARRVNLDKSFADYLSCRREEDGYSPIQVLENVSYFYGLFPLRFRMRKISNVSEFKSAAEMWFTRCYIPI
jgi:hypothetical protein